MATGRGDLVGLHEPQGRETLAEGGSLGVQVTSVFQDTASPTALVDPDHVGRGEASGENFCFGEHPRVQQDQTRRYRITVIIVLCHCVRFSYMMESEIHREEGVMTEETKVCGKCRKRKDISRFSRSWVRNRQKYQIRHLCKQCEVSQMQVRRKQDPEGRHRFIKNHDLLRYYGIRIEEYDRMISDQKNACQICGRKEEAKRQNHINHLCVDHCHKTGMVRGLICNGCNIALPAIERDPDWGRKAKAYLAKHRTGCQADLLGDMG